MILLKNQDYKIVLRKNTKNLYASIFDKTENRWLPIKSTKTEKVSEAKSKINRWMNKNSSNSSIIMHNFYKVLIEEKIKKSDVNFICNYFKEKGYISNYVLKNSLTDLKAKTYFENFYDSEKSDYLKEKERTGHPLCKSTINNNFGLVKKYWIPFLKDKYLTELKTLDLRKFIDNLQNNSKISNVTKKTIVSSGFKVLRWAYKTEIISKDITSGIKNFSSKTKERKILTPEIIKKLFNSEWNSKSAKLANLLAFCTGMRAGEIVALKYEDIGENCIYLQHSYSLYDGLKSTKSGKPRVVYIYEKELLNLLKKMCKQNRKNSEKFIFASPVNPTKPLRTESLLRALKKQLVIIGLPKQYAKTFTFHSWRHFHDTYLKDKIDSRILENQSGHSIEMIEKLYANHEKPTDKEELFQAQKNIFGPILEPCVKDFKFE